MKKTFSLMMTLLLAFIGVARADVVEVGVGGTETNSYLPSYSYYNYSLTQQIYTAEEIGMAGTINSIAFYNGGSEKTRTYDMYLVNTTKNVFDDNYDWIAVTAADMVFSGSVTMVADAWTTITLDTPFEYDGESNLAVIVDDNTNDWSSGMACRVFTTSYLQAIRVYSDPTNYDPSDPSNYYGTTMDVKNQLQLDITPAAGPTPPPVVGEQIFAVQDGEVVSTVEVGARPTGYWMEPFTFQIRNTGAATTITHLDWTPDDYFTLLTPELPVQIAQDEDIEVQLATGVTENTDWQMVAIYGDGRTAAVWNITAEPYEAAMPDVWELACEEATTFPFVEVPATDHDATLYDNYTLPFPEIAEGYDAVYKLVFDNDVMLNAEVTSGANGKVALYTEDFNGEGGPMADNNYTGLLNAAGGSAAGAPFEAQIGEGTTSTTGYFPFYTWYNYSIAENLYLATELAEAGVTTAPMTSLSWYATNETGYAQQGITIWMANVADEELTATSHDVTGMTKVYTGTVTPAIGWNEFAFNEGTFAWDGVSNVLIFCQRNNGSYNTAIQWQATTAMPFTCMAYRYQDSGAYDPTLANAMYTSTTRPNIIMKASARATAPVATTAEISYGPVITDAPVPAGTYYLVASSTDQDFEVTINAEDMPCPEVDGFAFNPIPADDEDEIEPASVLLQWMNPEYATSYQVFFGSTYYPEPGHVNTQISEVLPVTGATGSFRVNNLWRNTNYFWYVVFYNDGACQDGVESPHWGFTTHLNVPQNLVVDDEAIFDDETVTLTWSSIVDRTYRKYGIYRDGVKIAEVSLNDVNNTTYTDGPLAYNMNGYEYYVTAIYDEGESAPSNTVNVKVSGYGEVNGHVYDMDGVTGIANATVTMEGTDEFGDPHTYTYTTDENGYYEGQPYAGSYDGSAACNGYQGIDAPVQGNPIDIVYNNTTTPIDYVMDENLTPVCAVIAQYYPDSLDPNSPYVKVYWGCGLPGEDIIEDFETGDFSQFDWQVDPSHPWTITTNNPYEGTYCMKSGGAGVANVVSNMTVTVNIPTDGLMKFFGKISSENNYDYGRFFIDGVEKGSYSGAGQWTERTFDVTAGDHTFQWRYTKDGSVNSNDDCFYVDYITFYTQPEPAMPGMTYTFEDGTMQGWTSVDADGDGFGWKMASDVMGTGYGHNSSTDCVLSQSYDNNYGVLYPDNYLVSPQVQLGGIVKFYACAQDASYAAEHFGVAVSTTNTNPSSFTTIQEWTMSAKGVSAPKKVDADPTADVRGMGHSREGNLRAQGTWYEYTVDLSAYSGNGYVAIRHFNCSDMFYLDVDDITIGEPGKGVAETRSFNHYRIYRTDCYNDGPYTEENTVLLATNWPGDTVYIDVEWADLNPGVYKWGVSKVYTGNRGEENQSQISWSEPVNVNNAETARATMPVTFNLFDSWGDGWNGNYLNVTATDGTNESLTLASGSSGTEVLNIEEGAHVTLTWTTGSYVTETSFNVVIDGHVIFEGNYTSLPFEFDVTASGGSGSGSQGGTTYGPGGEPIQLDRESVIVWSNCLDKDMYLNGVTLNVLLNSADNPEGIQVTFTNYNEYEQQTYGGYEVIMDETGFYAFESFRKGEYKIDITFDGYYDMQDSVSIWEPTDLRYVMTEIIYSVTDLYVSSTGWAMWDAMGLPTGGQGGGQGTVGDWYYYDNGVNEDAIGTGGGNFWWGVMFPAGSYTGNMVTKVSAYDYMAMNGNVTIYQGGATAPGTAVGQTNVTFTGSEDFVEFEFASPVTVDPTQNIWVVFYNASGATYPAAVCANTGDANGRWVSLDGTTWDDLAGYGLDYTFMVRAYIEGEAKGEVKEINVNAPIAQNNGTLAISGNGPRVSAKNAEEERHLESFKVMCTSLDGEPIYNNNVPAEQPFCQLATDDLIPGNHYIAKVAAIYSTGMSDWVEQEWQYIPCTEYAGTVNGVTIEGNVISWDYPGGGSGPVPGQGDTFTESWDNGLNGWTNIDADGDGHVWYHSTQAGNHSTAAVASHSGAGHIMGESYCNGGGALTPNDYLVSPQQYAIAAGSTISLWACTQDVSYPSEHFGFAISTGSNTNASDFTTIAEWTITAKGAGNGIIGRDSKNTREGNWYQFSADLSSYAGQNVWIAVRHFNCTDMFILNIDDIELSNGGKANRNPWDLMMTFEAAEGGQYGVAYDGNNFYTSNWGYSGATNNFYKYDLQGNMLEGFNISGCGTLRGMTYDGEFFYGVANSSTVYCVDLANHTLANSFTSAYGAMRGITYDPERDGFWVIGNWSGNLTLIDRTGAIVTTGPAPTSASDLAYYKDANDVEHIYCFNNGTCDVEDWVIGNSAMSGSVFNFTSVPGYNAGSSGGCNVGSFNGKIAFMGDIQQSPNLIGVYELRDDDTPAPVPTPTGDVLGAMIFADGEWEAFVAAPTNTYTYEGNAEEVCVRLVYNGSNNLPEGNIYYSMSCPECEPFTPAPGTCEPGAPIHSELVDSNHIKVWWGEEPQAPVEEWIYYDNGTYSDAIGTGGSTVYWACMFPAASIAPYAGTNLTKVAMYEDPSLNIQPITVTVYLGGTSAPQTAVSTQTINPTGSEGFHEVTLNTPVAVDGAQNLWIVYSEYGTYPATGCDDTGDANGRWISVDGSSWEDVAGYGLNYTWMIRGFLTNQAKGSVQNIAIEPAKPVQTETVNSLSAAGLNANRPADLSFMNRASLVKYNIYRSADNQTYEFLDEVAETGATYYEYIDSPTAAGTYYYQVTAVYDNDCESEPALAADGSGHNYVSETTTTTGVEENDGMAIFPNPTKGNVTIQANGMQHITIVSVLGQVVYDADVNTNEVILNMSQFTAGMYTVRVVTENGIRVERVSVVR